MKRLILIVILTCVPMFAFEATESHHVDFSISGFNFAESSNRVHITIPGAFYRYNLYPSDFGFYLGFDGTVVFPTVRTIYSKGYVSYRSSRFASGLFLMMPLGYRWPGEGQGSGFFLGLNP